MIGIIGLLFLAALAPGQDPYVTAPKNYKLEFENDYVRVSRAKLQPGDKLPVHSHPGVPTIYVYLDDGGPIRFSHQTPKFTIERPAVKAGAVRFNRNAQIETHEVEYLGTTPTEYFRIELKTVPAPPHRDARLKLDGDFPWEDTQVRISRAQGKASRMARPAILVNIREKSFAWIDANAEIPVAASVFVAVELKSDLAIRAGK
jgi:hypothetical protein